ncbi:MAG TPA: hypothetical protein VGT98_16180 [Candidatus Elarobacter sp.]|nr:hypothetical protein [Candidatus Elarobacter sp.]
MLHLGYARAVRRIIETGAAVVALSWTVACTASMSRPATVADLGDPNPSGCVGPATVFVNNTYSQPVDIFAGLSGGRETFLGTAPPGRSEYALTDADASFAVRPVGQRTILEATSRPRPATDKVQFKTTCKDVV